MPRIPAVYVPEANAVISVAIPTYRRPRELTELLTHLLPQVRDAATRHGPVEIVVADNDPGDSARATVEKWRADHEPPRLPVGLRVVHEPTPGIAAVRNRLLDETRSSELLVFIDDDQIPSEGWLDTLLSAKRAPGAPDAIAGPVRPRYSDGVAEWIVQGPFHDAPYLATGTPMDHAASGNLLLDRQVVERLGIRFPDYGTRGAEDTAFTQALTDAGATLQWCAEAVAVEPVPSARTTPRWVLTRSLGNGLSWGDLLVTRSTGSGRPNQARRRLAVSAQGGARVVAGVATLAAAVISRSPARLGWAGHRIARGAGMVAGAWGVTYDEYARPGQGRWRRVTHGA